jgi:hypothetical protein
MLRLDPLTESKRFDIDFFQSEEFESCREVTLKYLKVEGFEDIAPGEEIIILISDRWWSVKNTISQQPK